LITDLDTLVQQVRSQRQEKIQYQCGTLQLLDMSHLAKIDDLYIDVNILEEIPSQQWLELGDLGRFTPNEFDKIGLGEVSQTQIAGVKAVGIYSKLRVLGKPGAGKTTFLQHLAMRCNQGSFAGDRVPIFITLRDFADESRATGEFSLFNYIHEEFIASGISDLSILKTLLREGRLLLLLDGLDEVIDQERKAVAKEIRRLSEKYHRNLFVVTCRTTTKAGNLGRFTDVEMAPFLQEQIVAFTQKWFIALSKTIQAGQSQAAQFIEKLDLPENLPLRRLAVTPLFLHLACWVFHHRGEFSGKRSEFYKQCLDLLLDKWDEARGIERDEIYSDLTSVQKLKLLGQIAWITFEQGSYFFTQQVVEQQISDYIQKLPGSVIDSEELQLDSQEILKEIELQHGVLVERSQGIFSFSAQAFQDYYTARSIVASHNLQAPDQKLQRLVSHITEPRWQEVFLLTVEMLRSADFLLQLMKQQIDTIVADDSYLKEFLAWTIQKPLATLPQPAAIRVIYFTLTKNPHFISDLALAFTLSQEVIINIILDDLTLKCVTASSSDFALIRAYINALSKALIGMLDVRLYHALQALKDQLPDPASSNKMLHGWGQINFLNWIEQLKKVIAQYHYPQREWHFSLEQQETLQRYYDANQLLLDCLNSSCEVTSTVRQEIEATLLLPQKDLEERK
jgi:predicted NACHT family NTPase